MAKSPIIKAGDPGLKKTEVVAVVMLESKLAALASVVVVGTKCRGDVDVASWKQRSHCSEVVHGQWVAIRERLLKSVWR